MYIIIICYTIDQTLILLSMFELNVIMLLTLNDSVVLCN